MKSSDDESKDAVLGDNAHEKMGSASNLGSVPYLKVLFAAAKNNSSQVETTALSSSTLTVETNETVPANTSVVREFSTKDRFTSTNICLFK
eukprot:scaffold92943_cov72-Cyclotella_meneghiniana.AAC.2